MEDPEGFGSLESLDASPFERFNVYIKPAFRNTSQNQASGMLETVCVMDATSERLRMVKARDSERFFDVWETKPN